MTSVLGFSELVKASARTDGYRFLGLSSYNLSTGNAISDNSEFQKNTNDSLEQKFSKDVFYNWAQAQAPFIQPWFQKVDSRKNATFYLDLNEKTNNDIQGTIGHIHLSEDSNWEGLIIQDWSIDLHSFIRIAIDVAKGARGKLFIVQKGSVKSQLRIEAELLGAHSELEINILTLGASEQVLENWVSVKHLAPHTKSVVQGTAVLRDQSHCIFKGILDIGKEAPFSDAYQKSKNLMLSSEARVDTIPQLWIAQDEVKCAHGASVSQADPEQSFYLQSRGLSREDAEQWISSGLIHDRTQTISDLDLRARAEKACGVDQPEIWS